MKRIFNTVLILSIILIFTVTASAENGEQIYSFNLTAANKIELTSSIGDEFEVAVELKREDSNDITMYAASYVLMFDTSFFEFDQSQIDFGSTNKDGITYLYSDNTGINGWSSITVSIYPGIFEGVPWDNNTQILKFNLKAKKNGASTILCRNAAMSNIAGQSYTTKKNNVIVTIEETDNNQSGNKPGQNSGSSGNQSENKPEDNSGNGSEENMTFLDVPKDTYYYDSVRWAIDNNITKGTDNNHFSPNLEVSRAQVVTFLYRAAGEPEVKGDNPFVDVSKDAYYYNAIIWAVNNNLTTGIDNLHFSPNLVCNRAQIVTFLARANNVEQFLKYSRFKDVDPSSYYSYAVTWADENNITNGISEDLFGPSEKCNRAQTVTFLYRSMK